MKRSLISALLVGQGIANPVAQPQFGVGNDFAFGGLNQDTQANFADPESQENMEAFGHALSHIEQMFTSWQQENQGSGGTLGFLIQSIDAKFPVLNYGCYCFLNSDPVMSGSTAVFAELPGPLPGSGGATPMDELDALCYDLYRYQQCIVSDVSAGLYSNPCVLNDGYYYQTIENTGNGEHGCTEEDWKPVGSYDASQSFQTLNDCRHALCMGDRDFSNKVATLYNGGSFNRNPAYFAMVQKDTYAANCVGQTTVPVSTGGSTGGTTTTTGGASGGAGGATYTGGASGNTGGAPANTVVNTGADQCCGHEVDRRPMNTATAQCCTDSGTGFEYLAGLGDICS